MYSAKTALYISPRRRLQSNMERALAKARKSVRGVLDTTTSDHIVTPPQASVGAMGSVARSLVSCWCVVSCAGAMHPESSG